MSDPFGTKKAAKRAKRQSAAAQTQAKKEMKQSEKQFNTMQAESQQQYAAQSEIAKEQNEQLKAQTEAMREQIGLSKAEFEETKSKLNKQQKRRLPMDKDQSIMARVRQRRQSVMKRKGRQSSILTDELRSSTGGLRTSLGG